MGQGKCRRDTIKQASGLIVQKLFLPARKLLLFWLHNWLLTYCVVSLSSTHRHTKKQQQGFRCGNHIWQDNLNRSIPFVMRSRVHTYPWKSSNDKKIKIKNKENEVDKQKVKVYKIYNIQFTSSCNSWWSLV